MAEQITAAEVAAVNALRGYAQVMVRSLAATGKMVYLPEVEVFQTAWNDSKTLVNKASALNGQPPYWYKLVVDGLYGPKTAGALKFVISPSPSVPPDKATGMPTWYAQNRDFIESLVPPQDSTAETLRAATAPLDEHSAHNIVDPEALVDSARSGGIATATVAASPPPPITAASSDVQPMWCNELPAGQREMCWFERHDITSAVAGGCREVLTPQGDFDVVCNNWPAAKGVPAEALDWTPATTQPAQEAVPVVRDVVSVPVPTSFDTHVRAASTKGRLPLVALLVGGAALGGVLFWFTRKRRRG